MKNFEAAIKEETEYLLMIDDIINEIGMIKRVQQDQDRIGIEVAGGLSYGHPGASPRNPADSPTGLQTTTGTGPSQESPPAFAQADHHDHQIVSHGGDPDALSFSVRQENPLRSAKSRQMITKLDRMEEDARRVRKSVCKPTYPTCYAVFQNKLAVDLCVSLSLSLRSSPS